MYKTRQWKEGELAHYFPQHIYVRPQPCVIKEVDAFGIVRKIFFHERRIMPGCEDWGLHDKILGINDGRFLQEYVLTSEDIEDIFE